MVLATLMLSSDEEADQSSKFCALKLSNSLLINTLVSKHLSRAHSVTPTELSPRSSKE